MFLFADVRHGFIEQTLHLVRGDVGKSLADLTDPLIEQAPFDGILYELRECAFLEAARAEVGTQSSISVFGPSDG